MKSFFTFLLPFFCITAFAQTVPKELWNVCYNDTATGIAFENDMATDAYGNTYITGYLQEREDNNYNLTHFYVLKNDAFGVTQWVRYFPADSTPVSRYNSGSAIAVDAKGNVYVTGNTYDTTCNICTIQKPHEDVFTIKYNSQGNIAWINKYAGPDLTFQTAADLTVAADGNIYLVGSELKYNKVTFNYTQKMFAQKIKPNGSNGWIKKVAATIGKVVSMDKAGHILIGGAADPENTYQLTSPEVMVYNSNGDSLWTKIFYEPGKNGTIYSIGSDNDGNIYANGQTDTLTFFNIPKVITLKYAADGSLLWFKKGEPYTETTPHIFGDFYVDAKGNSYTASTLTNSDFYNSKWIVSKYNSAGKQLWSNIYRDSVFTEDNPTSIIVDSKNNVYAAGNSYVAERKNQLYTTIKYNAKGEQQWVANYPDKRKSAGFANSIGLDALQNIYVSGNATGGICTVKYQSAVVAEKNIAAANAAVTSNIPALYPNPCKDVLYIAAKGFNGNYTYAVADISGRIIDAGSNISFTKGSVQPVNTKDLAPGFYTLRLSNKTNSYTLKFIKQ